MPQEPPAAQWEMGDRDPVSPPGQCPIRAAVWECPIRGLPQGREGGDKRIPKRNPPERSLPGKGRRAQQRAGRHSKGQEGTEKGTVLYQSCVKCRCSFPLKRGKRWSFIPSSPAGPREQQEALSCSALPLPAPLAPALGSPWSHCRHSQERDKAPRPARGWGRAQPLLGHLTRLDCSPRRR